VALAALFAILFALPQWAEAQSIIIDCDYVNGQTSGDVTGEWLKSGRVHWDMKTKTLTLDNAQIEASAGVYQTIHIDRMNCTVKLVGSNTVTNAGAETSYKAITLSYSTVTITGDGSSSSLTTNSDWMDISFSSNSSLTLDNCVVETTKLMGNNSGPWFDNHLIVNNATLKTPAITYLTTITLTDCYIQSPEGATVQDKVVEDVTGQIIVDAEGVEVWEGLVIVPGSADAVSAPESASASVQEVYSLSGVSQSRVKRGVNVVRMSDGKIRKVIRR